MPEVAFWQRDLLNCHHKWSYRSAWNCALLSCHQRATEVSCLAAESGVATSIGRKVVEGRWRAGRRRDRTESRPEGVDLAAMMHAKSCSLLFMAAHPFLLCGLAPANEPTQVQRDLLQSRKLIEG